MINKVIIYSAKILVISIKANKQNIVINLNSEIKIIKNETNERGIKIIKIAVIKILSS